MKPIQILYSFLCILCLLSSSAVAQDDYQKKREDMVTEQIVRRGVYHNATLQAMRKVPRHLFVPEQLRNLAYFDQPLPIGYDQTISQPYIVAYMTAAIKPRAGMKVLEIGTGSGYQAAVLAEIVDSVFTIEIVEGLGKQAIKRFKELGYDNVYTRIGDGYLGWPEHAPFDAIVVTAAPETVPPPLIEQLKDGGKMIIPIGPSFMAQQLQLVEKKGNNIKITNLFPVRFVPFTRHE